MENLVKELNRLTVLYDAGTPEVSDYEWDKMYWELVDMEREYGFALPDSPTQKVHFETVSELKKVKHNHLMLSLAKTKDWNEFVNYFNPKKEVIAMLKLDGLTCSLKYEKGKLVAAETRGNGEVGEDILHNAKTIKSIPNSIDYKEILILDGEIICTYKDFIPFEEKYKNPRNFASGSIRLLDSKECANRNLTFVVWNVIKGFEGNSFSKKLNQAEKYGFTTTPYVTSIVDTTKEDLVDVAREKGFPIDGLVARYDDIEYGEGLGSTGHHSRAAYAFKFYDEEASSRLKNIEWSLGRTGILTPVAIFEPVELEGTTINRSSLHNISVMEEIMGECCYLGQNIKIIKANQIIPQIVWADKRSYGEVVSKGGVTVDGFSGELLCPVCGGGTAIIKSESGVKNLVCTNPSCSGKLANKIEHYCDRVKGNDIRGLSKKTIEKLIEWEWVKTISDIYSLSTYEREWKNKPGFGEKSVSNILNAIELSKRASLPQFISSLGIDLIGTRAAKVLANRFKTWEKFREFIDDKKSTFEEIEGFGEEMNYALKKFDYAEADKIAQMLTFEEVVESAAAADLGGKTFSITGKLSRKRDDIKADIENAGGKVTGSVSSKTTYLVCNDKNSTTGKSAKAKQLNIPIITEEELMALLK